MTEEHEKINSLGIFDLKDNTLLGKSWRLRGTIYIYHIFDSEFSLPTQRRWYTQLLYNSEATFEEVLLDVPPEIQEVLLFNLDLFKG